jgi:hypothetical protein
MYSEYMKETKQWQDKINEQLMESFIKENPCPFKESESTVCRLMPYKPLLKIQCVGEKKCPIYNGGMK